MRDVILGLDQRVGEFGLHRGRDVLHERAAGGDVQHLRAPADGEDRQVGVHRAARHVDFELVASRLGVFDARVALLTVEHGVHVAAAGEQESVELRHDLARAVGDFQHAWAPAGLLHRREVVVETAAAGDADDGCFHGYIFAGTRQPMSSSACVSWRR